MQLNTLDILVIIIILISTILGLLKGSIKIILSIIGQVGAIFFAYRYHHLLGKLISHYIHSKLIVDVSSVIFTYFISLISFSLINAAILKLLDKYHKTSLDKFFGASLGFARGIIISYIIIIVLLICGSDSYLKAEDTEDLIKKTELEQCPNWMNEAFFAQKFHALSLKLIAILPSNLINTKYKTSTIDHGEDIQIKDQIEEFELESLE